MALRIWIAADFWLGVRHTRETSVGIHSITNYLIMILLPS